MNTKYAEFLAAILVACAYGMVIFVAIMARKSRIITRK